MMAVERESSRSGRRFGLALVVLVGLGFGCEDSPEDSGTAPDVERGAASRVESAMAEWEATESRDLREPPKGKRRKLELSEPTDYPMCRKLFETDGEPFEKLLPEYKRKAVVLAGCEPEASIRRDGRWYVAYSLRDENSEAGDMRLVIYEEGQLLWHARLDRSQYADAFTPNYRSSFIAPLLPQLVCAGTLWEGGTQASCWRADSGKHVWGSELKFWSGIPLQGVETSLHGADISGLTRRYPYSGVEMRRVDFEHRGGPGGLYMTDGRRLFFAPQKEGPSRLTAYDFGGMQKIWRVDLPGHPDPGYRRQIHRRHDLGLLKIEGTLFGFGLESGDLRWRAEVGEDRPPTTASDDRLYLLLRRAERSNLLYVLEPASGEVLWYAPVPTGTLELEWVDGTLTIGSVEAIQRVLDARGD